MRSAKSSFTRCWHCGQGVPAKRARLESVLHTRTAAEGGPYRSLRCSGCGADNGVIENSKGAVLLHPLEGLTEPTLLDRIVPRQSRELLRSAEEWWARNVVAVQTFRAGRDGVPPPRRPAGSRPRPKRRRPARPPQEEPSTSARHSSRGSEGRAAGSEEHAAPPPPVPPGPPVPFDARAPHDLLGIAEDADEATIRSAYRAALKLCHPDRVANLDPEIQDLATTKSKALRRAYERLLSRRQAGG